MAHCMCWSHGFESADVFEQLHWQIVQHRCAVCKMWSMRILWRGKLLGGPWLLGNSRRPMSMGCGDMVELQQDQGKKKRSARKTVKIWKVTHSNLSWECQRSGSGVGEGLDLECCSCLRGKDGLPNTTEKARGKDERKKRTLAGFEPGSGADAYGFSDADSGGRGGL